MFLQVKQILPTLYQVRDKNIVNETGSERIIKHVETLVSFPAKERIMNNLKKFDTPKPPLPLQTMKAPVPVISSASLVSQKEAIQLMRMDLNILQRHAK